MTDSEAVVALALALLTVDCTPLLRVGEVESSPSDEAADVASLRKNDVDNATLVAWSNRVVAGEEALTKNVESAVRVNSVVPVGSLLVELADIDEAPVLSRSAVVFA